MENVITKSKRLTNTEKQQAQAYAKKEWAKVFCHR